MTLPLEDHGDRIHEIVEDVQRVEMRWLDARATTKGAGCPAPWD
jgi:hypothetical protein